MDANIVTHEEILREAKKWKDHLVYCNVNSFAVADMKSMFFATDYLVGWVKDKDRYKIYAFRFGRRGRNRFLDFVCSKKGNEGVYLRGELFYANGSYH